MVSASEYERKREERIARNREIMASLLGDAATMFQARADATAKRALQKPPHLAATSKRARLTVDAAPEHVERRVSARLRNKARVAYFMDHDTDEVSEAKHKRSLEKKYDVKPSIVHGPSTATAEAERVGAARVPGSIRDLNAEIGYLREHFLGKTLAPTDGTGAMKQRVVSVLSPVHGPRFSKYSGIHEWNNCVCLFVNVGDKNGNCYDNVFTDRGGQMTWFAQERHNEETPVVQRIMRCNAGSLGSKGAEQDVIEEGGVEGMDSLHLFCRHEGAPYVYCGRLLSFEYYKGTRPLKFNLQLLDADVLRECDDFLALVELGTGTTK